MSKSHSSHCGLDFGTTNSSLAITADNNPQIVPLDRQNSNTSILKSLLYINPSQQSAVGAEAVKRYLHDLENLPSTPLRLVETGKMIKVMTPTGSGTMKADWIPEIIEVDDSGRGRLLQSLKSVLSSTNFTGTNIFGRFYTLEDLLGILMRQIKTRAETELGHQLDSVVLGRPVKYVGTGKEETALRRMTQIASTAGFKNIEFEFEPIGAALNYGLNINENKNILVFDFGGGTLDICIMKLPEKKILAVSGRGIGGDLLNARLVESKLAKYFGVYSLVSGKVPFPGNFRLALTSWYQTSLLKNVKDLGTLKDLVLKTDQPEYVKNYCHLVEHDYAFDFFSTVDRLKINLSTQDQEQLVFSRPHLHLHQSISRSEFEASIADELEETTSCLNESLSIAGLKSSQIDQVILTGGSSQTPVFHRLISSMFTPEKVIASDYFTAVAAGLSLRAQQIFT